MIHGLLRSQLGHGRQHAKGIRSQKDNGFRMASHARQQSIIDVMQGISRTGIFRQHNIIIIGHAVFVQNNIFQHRILANGSENLGLRVFAQVNALGIAAALDIKNAVLAPAVLVVPY